MSSSLETKFTGDGSQLQSEYQKIARENVKLREEAKKTAEEHARGGEKANQLAEAMSEHLGEQVRGLMQMGAEWLTVNKAIELASEAHEHFNELQREALDAQVEAGVSRGQLYRNTAGLSPNENALLREKLDELADQYRIKGEDPLNQAAVAALSATGGNLPQAMKNLEQAVRIVPDATQNPAELAAVAGALGDMTKVTGDTDAERNMGLLLAVQSGARVAKLSDVEQNLMRAAIAARSHGATSQETWALLGGLGQAISDPEGAETKTGVIKLTQSMDEFFDPRNIEGRVVASLGAERNKEASGQEIDAALRARVVGFAESHDIRGAGKYAFSDLLGEKGIIAERGLMRELVESETARVSGVAGQHDFGRQLQALRTNKDLQEQFLAQKGDFGRADTISALTGFIQSPDSLMGRTYQEQLAKLPVGEAQRQTARDLVAQIHGDPKIAAMEARQGAEQALERDRVENTAYARDQAYKEGFASLLEISNKGRMSGIENPLARWSMSFGHWLGFADSDPERMFLNESARAIRTRRYEATGATTSPEWFYNASLDPEEGVRSGLLRRRDDPKDEAVASRIEGLLQRTAESVERLVAHEDSRREQADRHHNENQTTARQNGARIEAAKPRGRE